MRSYEAYGNEVLKELLNDRKQTGIIFMESNPQDPARLRRRRAGLAPMTVVDRLGRYRCFRAMPPRARIFAGLVLIGISAVVVLAGKVRSRERLRLRFEALCRRSFRRDASALRCGRTAKPDVKAVIAKTATEWCDDHRRELAPVRQGLHSPQRTLKRFGMEL
jgi:hypothetical protein